MDKLLSFRTRIDKVDAKIVALLRKREQIVRKVGVLKDKTKKPAQDKKREEIVLSQCNTEMEKEVFKTIIKESKKIQRGV